VTKLSTPKQNDDILEGYLDGYSSARLEYPDSLANRSELYRHGWENGRDDRIGIPRSTAANIRYGLFMLADADRDLI
jgi:hypothetical protein